MIFSFSLGPWIFRFSFSLGPKIFWYSRAGKIYFQGAAIFTRTQDIQIYILNFTWIQDWFSWGCHFHSKTKMIHFLWGAAIFTWKAKYSNSYSDPRNSNFHFAPRYSNFHFHLDSKHLNFHMDLRYSTFHLILDPRYFHVQDSFFFNRNQYILRQFCTTGPNISLGPQIFKISFFLDPRSVYVQDSFIFNRN